MLFLDPHQPWPQWRRRSCCKIGKTLVFLSLSHLYIAADPPTSKKTMYSSSAFVFKAKFALSWMKKNDRIDQREYQKSVIKMNSKGLCLEFIFYPTVGEKATIVRSEFIIMLLDASQRLDLCLSHAEVRTSAPWPVEETIDDETEEKYSRIDLNDLMPGTELTSRAGYKQKSS